MLEIHKADSLGVVREMVMQLMDHWMLSTETKLKLLGGRLEDRGVYTPNSAFGGSTPVNIMERQGLIGFHEVSLYLHRQKVNET